MMTASLLNSKRTVGWRVPRPPPPFPQVNGRTVDVISRLPTFKNWVWYVGMWTGGDMSCSVFQKDGYAVYWGDYCVKRFT